jgi:SAM-dependent methyltransferase
MMPRKSADFLLTRDSSKPIASDKTLAVRTLGPRLPVFFAGAATLLVELTFLRYLASQVRILGYFTNFVLLAAFVGLGAGMIASSRWPRAEKLAHSAPLATAALVALAALGGGLRVMSSNDEVLFLEYQTHAPKVALYPFLGVAYIAVALAFAPVGYWVGRTLAGDDPLSRYAWNLAGGLAGIGVFVACSALGAPPWLWVALSGATLLPALAGASPAWKAMGAAGVLAATLGAWSGTRGAMWSPYQKISTAPLQVQPSLGIVQEWAIPRLTDEARRTLVTLPEDRGFTVRVNDDSYQTPVDLSPAAVSAQPGLAPMRVQYDLPYVARPPGRVLVLGAGTGNDVAAALRAGATSVDAVEIDPAILALGHRHPEHPYDDPRVRTHIEDARAFLARTADAFDTIVYGLLDSHILMGAMSNVRLDSYVFTAESFTLARSRLAPDGILVVSHAVGTPWFVDRMRATLALAFDRPPLLVSEQVHHPIGYVYAAGDRVPPGEPVAGGVSVLTDDWPFVYLRSRAIPGQYLGAMALMAAASIVLVRVGAGRAWRAVDLHFFALGAGFLLLETRGLSVLALLIGSTWYVTSAVFAGVLVMALASIALARSIGGAAASGRNVRLVYALLFTTLVVELVVDVGDLASLPLVVRAVLGAALVSSPLLASGTIFSTSLARAGAADRATASNLVGAVAGGLTEYASMVIGFRMLVLVAAAFYGLAFIAGRRHVAAR